jgi:hypothetical protein
MLRNHDIFNTFIVIFREEKNPLTISRLHRQRIFSANKNHLNG